MSSSSVLKLGKLNWGARPDAALALHCTNPACPGHPLPLLGCGVTVPTGTLRPAPLPGTPHGGAPLAGELR